MRFHAHLGIERAHACRGERGFFAAAVGERIPGLAMQVGGFEPVGVDDAERPTPAPARYCSTGTPRPPAPTTSTEAARSRAWPSAPTSRNAIWRE